MPPSIAMAMAQPSASAASATPAPPPVAPVFFLRFGFEAERTYNANVSCAVLLSFARAACVKDVEDYCRHKIVQLGVELDAIARLLSARGVQLNAPRPGSNASASRPGSSTAARPASRPPSGNAAAKKSASQLPPAEPAWTFTAEEDPDGSLAAAVAKKAMFEQQLEIVNTAARLAKELAARTAWVDLADANNARLKLDETPTARASSFVATQAHYRLVAVSANAQGELHATPLVFELPKLESEGSAT